MTPTYVVFTRRRPGPGKGQFTLLRGMDFRGREMWAKQGASAVKMLNLMRGLKVEVRKS